MWKSIGLTVVGLAAAGSSTVSIATAQGPMPPVPHPSMAPATSFYQPAPYQNGMLAGPAISGGYVVSGSSAAGYGTGGAGPGAGVGPFWAPGGYEARQGSPYLYHDPNGGQFVNTGNPYYDHFGPGFHRDQLHGHYRFPYYNYRAPWYYPGRAVYNRDTNFPW